MNWIIPTNFLRKANAMTDNKDEILTNNTPSITSFKGEYSWLSNFYPCDIIHEYLTYPSLEHAYQSCKTINSAEKLYIKNCLSAGSAKKAGKKLTIRADWDNIKLDVMRDLIYQKFSKHVDLREKLIETSPAHLQENNYWGDRFWGVCEGVGENHLGGILMEVRDQLIEEASQQFWQSNTEDYEY